MYTYRRQDGTIFEYKQSFSDAPLTTDPQTGQPVVRVVQAAGIIFKGSGFYVNDSKSASKTSLSKSNGHSNGTSESNGSTASESTSTTSSDSSTTSNGSSEKAASTETKTTTKAKAEAAAD
jgi:predicted nucleic acid-binding Zn ribbon protein